MANTQVEQIHSIRQNEKAREIRAVLNTITRQMVVPLYFVFWFADLVFAPNHKWEFLLYRALVIPMAMAVRLLLRSARTVNQAQWVSTAYMFGLASVIHLMIISLQDWSGPYYAGLNLVALGSLSFILFLKLF